MTTTIEQARAAKEKLKDIFNQMSSVQMNGIGVSKDKDGYYVKINLAQALPEGRTLWPEYDGVRIKYAVTGPNRPL